ncbi:MAG: GcrA cell cycle regulator [Parcubacteria group bacterium Gr01-1014_56]|nr:MAG: GcrA cell cycle regulator [Parcubacteria group bacterium Gr01-1014_56]
MAWTDERIELLKKLWAEGHSASEVAARLGGFENYPDKGRSAVLGKLNRLEIPSPAEKTGRQGPRVYQQKLRKAYPTNAAPKSGRPKKEPQTSTLPAVANGVEKIRLKEELPLRRLPGPKALVLINGEKVTVLHLSDKTCKWPIGDPGTEDFCFCGHTPRDKSPYCEYHARAAYQPMQDRRHRRYA